VEAEAEALILRIGSSNFTACEKKEKKNMVKMVVLFPFRGSCSCNMKLRSKRRKKIIRKMNRRGERMEEEGVPFMGCAYKA
jgi:hypothetical protein